MCKAVEDYAKEYAKEHAKEYAQEYAKEYAQEYSAIRELEYKIETVKNLLKERIPLEIALKCAQIDRETYEKHAKDMQ